MKIDMILFIVFSLSILLLWWSYAGYITTLHFMGKKREREKVAKILNEADLPSITFIVPCHNEEGYIEAKVKNTLNLDYPKDRLSVIFADGQSTDRTIEKLKEKLIGHPHMTVLQTRVRGKIPQINKVLPDVSSKIIVISDVDGLLKEDALLRLVEEFLHDPKVGVVGALIIPKHTIKSEEVFWRKNNEVRILESQAHSSSIVIAVCYSFKNGIIDQFPEDVVADDIYSSLQGNAKGFRVVYSNHAIAYEQRTPKDLNSMLKHKMRKSNAVLRELIRFMPHTFQRGFFWRVMYPTKLLQFMGFSILAPITAISTSLLIFDPVFRLFVALAFFLLGLSIYFTHHITVNIPV
ncbi:MAG: glycosyltransferase, partial [Candidatus Altiarchaeota archaeon]